MSEQTRILIVDDMPSARRVIIRLLAKMNFTAIVEAASGKEALEVMTTQGEPFELLIADLNLGDLSAIELLQKLAEVPKLQIPPTIIVTSDGDRESVLSSYNAGASSFLLKPFSYDSLKSKIDELLPEKESADHS